MIDWSVTPEQSFWLNLFAVLAAIAAIAFAFCWATADDDDDDWEDDEWEELMQGNSEYQPPKEK